MQLLGDPAPARIKDQFAAVNRGLPESLRLQVDAAGAVSVAATDRSTLYLARIRGGGYCMQMVSGHTPDGGGVTCTSDDRVGTLPIDVIAPHSDGSGPVTIAGRANISAAASATLVYADGSRASVPFGTDRFFVVDIPDERVASVREDGLEIAAAGAAGNELTRATIPADWDQSAEAAPPAPIDLSTKSDEDDLTKGLRVHGPRNSGGSDDARTCLHGRRDRANPAGRGWCFRLRPAGCPTRRLHAAPTAPGSKRPGRRCGRDAGCCGGVLASRRTAIAKV
ncbi:MAG: hypothetical protein ABR583_11980 [Gaiellaceae bacterium]